TRLSLGLSHRRCAGVWATSTPPPGLSGRIVGGRSSSRLVRRRSRYSSREGSLTAHGVWVLLDRRRARPGLGGGRGADAQGWLDGRRAVGPGDLATQWGLRYP